MTDTLWERFDIGNKINAILRDIVKDDPQHYGQPFFTAYQLAIEISSRYPDDFAAMGKPVGGEGTGQPNSLSQYLAGEISRRIKSGKIRNIEIAFVHSRYVREMTFRHKGESVRASTPEAGFPISIFRLVSESD